MKLLPFMKAASELAEVCDEIENHQGDISESLLRRFHTAEAHLSHSIDRRKDFLAEVRSRIEFGKQRKKQIDNVLVTLKTIESNLKALTLAMLKANPNQRFRDSFGQSLRISKTRPILKLKAGIPISFDHALPGYEKGVYEGTYIEPQYVTPVITYCIDKEAVRAALEIGEKLDWASLEQTEFVNGWK